MTLWIAGIAADYRRNKSASNVAIAVLIHATTGLVGIPTLPGRACAASDHAVIYFKGADRLSRITFAA